ncbi:hypothetical protein ES703_66388 [subsurface metagenome]
MSPIDKISDIRRMPRLGKIRLGIKVKGEKSPYPRATDYFVVPEEVEKVVGPKPTKLQIMFPTEIIEEFAIQWLRCYSFSQGLICRGDGLLCRRKVDIVTGDFASHTTEEWVMHDGMPCEPNTCPMYVTPKPQCRKVMNLLFLMPDVPGFGVWQLDTSSFYSIINVNSSLDLIKRLCGRISFIPLTLSLEPQIVEPPGIKKKTVHILQVRSDAKLAEIQRLGRRKPERVLLPELDEDEIPTDLFLPEGGGEAPPQTPGGDEKVGAKVAGAGGGGKPAAATVSSQEEAKKKEKSRGEPATRRDPATVTEGDTPDLNALAKVCFQCWGMQPAAVWQELGYKSMLDVAESPWDCWLKIKAVKTDK